MKRFPPILLAVLCAALLCGCAAHDAQTAPAVTPDAELPGTPHAETGYIVVRGFEWGPGVNKVIVELDTEVDDVFPWDGMTVVTSHYDRTVTAAYLSDSLGNRAKTSSRCVAFELETSFDCTGSPFEVDMATEHNVWADSYVVDASFTVVKDDTHFPVRLYADCIENRICPELDRFSVSGSFSGEYENPLTHETEALTLTYAAYEPDSLASWEQNPLLIWLHGRGEGGDDIEKAILGNEVSALTETQIQSHFTAGEQTGAYVLVVQTPTYWMDGGDGRESRGDMPSRYTQILMDTIEYYLGQNPDVDPDRIYLGGGSNGGFMTLEMILSYPGFFAAGFPCSAAYAERVYARDWNGGYRMFWSEYIPTDEVYFTAEKAAALADTPLWFTAAVTDSIISVFEYTMPVYQSILRAGAKNCWCSMYFGVVGTESSDTIYLGHWSWVYLLNDEVRMVQNTESIRLSADPYFRGFGPGETDAETGLETGGSAYVTDQSGAPYESLFDWLNAQER